MKVTLGQVGDHGGPALLFYFSVTHSQNLLIDHLLCDLQVKSKGETKQRCSVNIDVLTLAFAQTILSSFFTQTVKEVNCI